jgi:hypothetical protein
MYIEWVNGGRGTTGFDAIDIGDWEFEVGETGIRD